MLGFLVVQPRSLLSAHGISERRVLDSADSARATRQHALYI